jgi:hypothetical protein
MDNVYGLTHVVGSSKTSLDDAIRNAVRTAARTVRHLEWFKVEDIHGHIVEGDVGHFQVTVQLGFRYDEAGSGQ